jgi:hypothetical protein
MWLGYDSEWLCDKTCIRGWRSNRPIVMIGRFSLEEKLVVPLIAAPNGECANEKTKDRGKKLDYRLRV